MTVTRVQHSRITGAGGVPAAGDLAVGELFLNLTDVSLFTKDGSTVISFIPKGIIVDWYGLAATVPTGWQICDGTGDTPNLSDKFIWSADIDADVGDIGGATTDVSTSDGAHDHSGAVGNTTLAASQIPSHYHDLWQTDSENTTPNLTNSNYPTKWNVPGAPDNAYSIHGTGTTPYQGRSQSIGGGGSHNHSIGNQAAHSHTVDILPPYHRLYKIMKL